MWSNCCDFVCACFHLLLVFDKLKFGILTLTAHQVCHLSLQLMGNSEFRAVPIRMPILGQNQAIDKHQRRAHV